MRGCSTALGDAVLILAQDLELEVAYQVLPPFTWWQLLLLQISELEKD